MRRVGIATTLLLVCVVRLGGAQVGTGRLAGVVEDQTGGVVPGAHVQILELAGHVRADTVTGPDGAFTVRDFPAGPATVQAELQGFRRASASVRIVAGHVATVPRLVLEIARVTQDVTVGPDRTAVPLAPDENRDAVVIDAPALRELPIHQGATAKAAS